VTIHNDGTNAEQTLVSDASGYFKAPLLEPGTYTVTIVSPGFSELRTTTQVVLGQVDATAARPEDGLGDGGYRRYF